MRSSRNETDANGMRTRTADPDTDLFQFGLLLVFVLLGLFRLALECLGGELKIGNG